MIKTAAELLQDNYKKIGPLTDEQFVAVKACACSKKLIYAEQVHEVRNVSMGVETPITFDEIDEDATVRIKATIRSMLGGAAKTGFITLPNIQEVYRDEARKMWVIEAENLILTTMDCKNEVLQINAVLAGDNWVNNITLSELITNDTILRDLQDIRDKEPDLILGDMNIDSIFEKENEDLSLGDFDSGFKTPDLLF